MPADEFCTVLFLCTHNSARSIMAEAILNHAGAGRFKAFSAGSMPGTSPHPLALRTLRDSRVATDGLRSKSWEVFATPDAPVMDLVITVCDNAAGEVCPVWPGRPISAHWGVEDPSRFAGTEDEKLREFARVAGILKGRIDLLTRLPVRELDRTTLERKVRELGRQ